MQALFLNFFIFFYLFKNREKKLFFYLLSVFSFTEVHTLCYNISDYIVYIREREEKNGKTNYSSRR